MNPTGAPRGQPHPLDGLPERSRRVLALLVREYIDRGEPVSSLWLADHASLGVSSATLRNIMAKLEAKRDRMIFFRIGPTRGIEIL